MTTDPIFWILLAAIVALCVRLFLLNREWDRINRRYGRPPRRKRRPNGELNWLEKVVGNFLGAGY